MTSPPSDPAVRFPFRHHLLPCGGPRCGPEHGEALQAELKRLLPDRKDLGVRISRTTCQGMCEKGPNLTVHPDGIVYHRVGLGDLGRIVEEHLRQGRVVEDLAADPGDNSRAEGG